MKILNTTDEIKWVDESTNQNSSPDRVDFIIPDIFDKYYKLFLPVGLKDDEIDSIKQIKPREIAELAGLQYDKSFSLNDIEEKFGGIPGDMVFKEFDNIFIEELVKILNIESDCIFHGFGDDIVPDEFELPWVIHGKTKDLKEIVKRLNHKNDWTLFNFYPNYIYDSNKNWFLGWRVQVNEIGVILFGCNSNISKRLIDNDTIDFIELSLTDNYLNFKK